MGKSHILILSMCLLAMLPAAAVDISPFGIDADAQFRSAYHSRMRVSEDRPVGVLEDRKSVV